MAKLLLSVTVAALFAAAPTLAAPPPVAVLRTVNDSYFGVTVADPYRYFEDRRDREAARWMKAHSERAAATLAAISGRAALATSIAAHEAATADDVAQAVRRPGELIFSLRRAADAPFTLGVRRGANGAERRLVDPQRLAIGGWQASPDGRRLAYALTVPGSEQATLHLLDVASGRPLGTPVARVNPASIDWAPDSRRLVVNRLGLPPRDDPEALDYGQVLLLTAGRPLASAKPVFGRGVAMQGATKGSATKGSATKGGATLDIAASELPSISLGHDGRWAIGAAAHGTQRELSLFAAPQAGVLAGRPAWRRVVQPADGVTAFALFGDTLYLLSHQNAPRSQVWAMDLKHGDAGTASVVVAESPQVIADIGAAADALYLETRDGNAKRLFRRPHGANHAVSEIALPPPGAFQLNDDNGGHATDPRRPGALIAIQGWTTPRRWFAVGADGSVGSVGDAGLQPATAALHGDYVTTEVRVPSHDGALVPLTLVHKRGLAPGGKHPTLLTAYAAYAVTEEPAFDAARLAWLDAGGVFAVANPRGSGADGEAWYRGGWQAAKPNGWKDVIACAEFLVAQGWTTPARLGLVGRSAGGIVAGRAMTERPDLFAAVVLQVAALDALRWESSPNGVPNRAEFGSVATEPGFRALLAMSTYAHIRPGTAYPAVLLSHGVQDPRVDVWESAKTAARLLAATSSGKPILLRLDENAGHGPGNTPQQQRDERADIFAFLLWQMGLPGYRVAAP